MRVRVRDDRGNPARVRWVWFTPDDASDNTRPWLVRQLRRAPEIIIPPIILVVGLLVLVTLAWREGPAVVAVTLFSPVSSSLIFVTIAMLLWMGRAGSQHLARTRLVLKRKKQCPSCRYNLAGLEADDDHCTPCPECGAAWDLRDKSGTEHIVIRADGSATSR